MLHFFRRIRRSFLESSQARKYIIYAIGEVLLVMVGILLALQVNTWNQHRMDQLEEKQILFHLNKEFLLNKVKMSEIREIMDNNQAACKEILTLIGASEAELKQKNLDSLIHYSLFFEGYNPTQNVLSDLLQSGRLQLITDDSLKNLLFEWSQVLLEMQEWYKIADGWCQQQVLPYLSKHISLRNTASYDVNNDIQPTKLNVDPALIFSDLLYENIMQNLQYVLRIYGERLERIDKIIDTIIEKTASS